jgi:multidrug efflux pump subunit AcrA (membrane-fusion protein)
LAGYPGFVDVLLHEYRKTDQQPEIQATPPSVTEETGSKQVIHLSGKERDELRIETARVTRNVRNYSLPVPGVVLPALNHVSIISTPIDGQIRAILVKDGQAVRQGQELFKLRAWPLGIWWLNICRRLPKKNFRPAVWNA